MLLHPLLAAALLTGACATASNNSPGATSPSSQAAAPPPPPPENRDFVTIVGGQDRWRAPSTVHQGVGLHARAEGSSLVISADNQRNQEVGFLPVDFALITGTDRQNDFHRISPSNANVKAVTPLLLPPGQRGVLTIPLRQPLPLRGSRLVYNNPRDGIQFFVIVE